MSSGSQRVLMLHPEDSLWDGPWTREKWDIIVDLGWAGKHVYEEWSRRTSALVLALKSFSSADDFCRIGDVFECGRDKLMDRFGVDWWELLCQTTYHRIHSILHIQRLRETLADGSNLFVTRPHADARMVGDALGREVHSFLQRERQPPPIRFLRALRTFTPAQIAEIAFDKFDPQFALRARSARKKRAKLSEAAVLLPSAYVNVSGTVAEYASMLPEKRFLLVTTRRSGEQGAFVKNVTRAPLAAYVPSTERAADESALVDGWRELRRGLPDVSVEFRSADAAGVFDGFEGMLKDAIRVRDCWREVLDTEPIQSVLCGDDLNHHTRLPIILAKARGMKTVYCNHGALDGPAAFKRPYADTYIVKGEMEKDFLQRQPRIKSEQIVTGAPVFSPKPLHQSVRGAVTFFSEPVDVYGGRVNEAYREIVPRLCAVAARTGREVVIKLHPFERRPVRQRILKSILSTAEFARIRFYEGTVSDLLSRTWCAVTVHSSVTVECTLQGVPCFLCGWLDIPGYGYAQQFAKYEAGRLLESPEDLLRIEELTAEFQPNDAVRKRLWKPIQHRSLERALFGHAMEPAFVPDRNTGR